MPESPLLNLKDIRPGMHFLQYEILEQIGAGGQGVVWSALDRKINRIVAIKFMETSNRQAQAVTDKVFEQQGYLFRELEHPNILPLYDFGCLQNLRYLVSLYIPGGSLQDALAVGRLAPEIALYVAAHIASALDYLHSREIIHRDLKPGNVLMDFKRNIYVFDFGLARILSDSTMALHTGHGTLPYAPPEQNNQSEITIQSDIYSFGIMLYQFFTGHIPWDGEMALGIQQLHLKEELPDPQEYNADLPPGLVMTLRNVTAAQPAVRPRSASEVMQLLYKDFNISPLPVDITHKIDASPLGLGTEEISKHAMNGWDVSSLEVPLTLTKFALIGLGYKISGNSDESGTYYSFMLHCALVYGYDVDFWWKEVENPQERLRIAAALIRRDNVPLTNRVLSTMIKDRIFIHSKVLLPDNLVLSLLEVASGKVNQDVKQNIFELLENMMFFPTHWQTPFQDPGVAKALANLAEENSPFGDRAAMMIGRLHSTDAVRQLLSGPNDVRRNRALSGVLLGADTLPAIVPRPLRWSLFTERFAKWLASNLPSLLGTYGLAVLGVFLGFGAQVYLTYRLPNFMDLTRISIAVERGVFMGFIFGFGIFISRLLSEILPSSKTSLRMAIATLTGGALLTIGLLIYDLLFLDSLPVGVLFSAGCFFIAAGFAVSQWVRPALVKISILIMVIFLALIGTWFAHLSLAVSPTGVSPIFYYDYGWPISQIIGTMLVATLPMAIFGSLGKIPKR